MPASPNYLIETNAHGLTLPLTEQQLEHAARVTLISENVASAELSLAVVDGETMRDLNNRHLQHDYDTDVLSFLLDQSKTPDGVTIEGEIIVSLDMAKKQASEHGTGLSHELKLYIIHGTLHLCGYDDLTTEEASVMRAREREVLNLIVGATPE